MSRTTSQTRRTALVVGLVAAVSLTAAGTAVALSTHTATAEDRPVLSAASEHRIQVERSDEVAHTPDQVVRGALGSDERTDAVTFAYAGDSITARPDSWLHVLQSDTALHAVGGYAHSGYRSDQVLAEVGPVPEARVLVVELGTNDVNQGRSAEHVVANVRAVVAKVGARHVLLVATPPSDRLSSLWGVDRRTGNAALNVRLARLAAESGWSYADPFAADRLPDGGWLAGTSRDGIHPTAVANETIARAFATDITRAAVAR